MQIECPSCGKKHEWTTTNRFRPFCSERCKQIDLGAWASETYRVAGNPIEDNALSAITETDLPH